MANSFDEKYKKNIDSLATANKVDTGTAAAMLRSNLAGTSNYAGGGVLNYNTANTDLKNYLNTPEARGASTNTGTVDNSSYLESIASARERAQIAALKKSVDNTVSGYEADIKNIPDQYQPLKDQTEVNRYTAEKSIKESLANTGQTASGFGRTEQLNLQTGQNKELSTLNATEQAAVDKLKLAISQAKAAGSQEELRINADSTASLMESLYNESVRAAQNQGAAEQQSFENWLKEQANNREEAELSYNLGKPYYKEGSGTSKPTLTYAQAKQLYDDGVKTTQVTDTLKYYTNQSFEGNLADVERRLADMSVPSSKIALIESYNTNGRLTDDEAETLLIKYGLVR